MSDQSEDILSNEDLDAANAEDILNQEQADEDGLKTDGDASGHRKVELDIEELPEALYEEEALPEEEDEAVPDAEADAEQEEEGPPPKRSRAKLFLLGAIGGLLLVVLIGIISLVFILGDKGAETNQPPPETMSLDLAPFVLSAPTDSSDQIGTLKITLTFSSIEGKSEFRDRRTIYRDLIYRFLQGRDPEEFESKDSRVVLQQRIAELLNEDMTRGRVDVVLFQEYTKL